MRRLSDFPGAVASPDDETDLDRRTWQHIAALLEAGGMAEFEDDQVDDEDDPGDELVDDETDLGDDVDEDDEPEGPVMPGNPGDVGLETRARKGGRR
jgi:hypothetical protein